MATGLIRWDPGNQFRRLITVPNQLLKERDGGGNARAFFQFGETLGWPRRDRFPLPTVVTEGTAAAGERTRMDRFSLPTVVTATEAACHAGGGGLPRGGGGQPRGGGGLPLVAPRQGSSVWCVMSSPKGKTFRQRYEMTCAQRNILILFEYF